MTRRPNILLITTDEERANLPGAAGYALPSHERLAERGVTFERYYTAATMCSSARSVIYTGRHLPYTGVYDNDNMPYIRPLPTELGTVGTMLRDAGYFTAYKGKWHLSNAYLDPSQPRSTVDDLEPYGFSEWNDWGDIDGGAWAGLKVDPVIAGQAAQWLRERAPLVAKDQPWFLAVNFVNPHDIMSFDYGSTGSVPLPPVLAHAMVVKPPAPVPLYQHRWEVERPANLRDDLASAAPAVREFAKVLDTTFGPVTADEHWQEGIAFYLNCVRDVDRHIGVVLDALAASGQDDDTMVVFTADHGEMAGSHGLRQKANLVYDENLHVPLIISHPEGPGGTASGAVASAVDLVPTILEAAGADLDAVRSRHEGLHGRSLLGALDGTPVRGGALACVETITTLDDGFWSGLGQEGAQDRVLSGELRPDLSKRGFLRAYLDERYSFGRYFAPFAPNRPTTLAELRAANDVVLYDRLTDPAEVTNLAADPANDALVEACLAKLEALITEEIGADDAAWVTERPNLVGQQTWHGDTIG